jgi:hypothetical protein
LHTRAGSNRRWSLRSRTAAARLYFCLMVTRQVTGTYSDCWRVLEMRFSRAERHQKK